MEVFLTNMVDFVMLLNSSDASIKTIVRMKDTPIYIGIYTEILSQMINDNLNPYLFLYK